MRLTTRNLVFTALIAAIYTALCMALAPLSFGMVQVRFAEALTLLPVYSVAGVWGVTLGCALSNLVGFMTGANLLGAIDVLFGTAATLIAAIASRKLRHIRIFGLPVLSALPPVIANAVVIGAELAWVTAPTEIFVKMFFINAAYVGAGQLISCVLLGLPLCALLDRTGVARLCFGSGKL